MDGDSVHAVGLQSTRMAYSGDTRKDERVDTLKTKRQTRNNRESARAARNTNALMGMSHIGTSLCAFPPRTQTLTL